MDYIKGEIFNKIGLIFKDGEKDSNPHGHPVIVLNDTHRIGKVYFVKMISDVTRMFEYPGRYMPIKNTKRNGLERPSLICLDEIYCVDNENEPVRGEITLKEYSDLIQRIFKYNTENGNDDEAYIEWRELVGDMGTYLKRVAYGWNH